METIVGDWDISKYEDKIFIYNVETDPFEVPRKRIPIIRIFESDLERECYQLELDLNKVKSDISYIEGSDIPNRRKVNILDKLNNHLSLKMEELRERKLNLLL